MADPYRYAAFISYSSRDAAFAQRLHRSLEAYSIPASLGAYRLSSGAKKNRVYPVFRDRDELSAGPLADRIEAGLDASAALIVVCSPDGAASPWVAKEIEYFAGLGRRDRIFAIIADTAPLTDAQGADATVASFPAAFRANALADRDALEPLAADARKGKDGFRRAWLKVVAGLIGAAPGQLLDRDKLRTHTRILQMSGAAVVLIAGVALSWIYSNQIVQEWARRTRYLPYVHGEQALKKEKIEFQDCRTGSADCPVMVALPVEFADSTVEPILALGKYEVTFDNWVACRAAGGCAGKTDLPDNGWGRGSRPLIYVSWDDAQEYVSWLSHMTGVRYRLPTSDEWDFATRATVAPDADVTPWSFGDDSSLLERYAWYGGNSNGSTHPVGELLPNVFGLHDTYGNVWEWVQTCNEQVSRRAKTCISHYYRGGCWEDNPLDVWSGAKGYINTTTRGRLLGFRVAREIRPEDTK